MRPALDQARACRRHWPGVRHDAAMLSGQLRQHHGLPSPLLAC